MRAVDVTTLKNVVVPAEHGASVMFAESLFAGLMIAASSKGFLLALGWAALFLMSNPLKIVIKDKLHCVFTPRTSMALWCSIIFGLLASVLFIATYIFSGPSFLLVLLGVIPLTILHLLAVVNAGRKELTAELSGALSLGGIAASIVLAAGYSYPQALVLWLVLAVRAMTSVVYVRERLSQSRAEINNFDVVNWTHIAGVTVLWALVIAHLVKPAIFLAGILLIMRLWFMYRRIPIRAKDLGLQELILGVVYATLVILAF